VASHGPADGGRDKHGQHEHGEVVQFGSARGPWLSRLLLACLVAATVAALIAHSGHGHSPPRPRRPAGPVTVINVGHHLLGVTGRWELFARGPDHLVAIQLAQGRITLTAVPPLQTELPQVSFIIGPHQVIVRSADLVPGYLIPDGAAPRVLAESLTNGGPAIPGPTTQQVWVLSGTSTNPSLSLVGLDGRATGESIRLQANRDLPATSTSDGRGYVLVLTIDSGLYDVGPTWFRPVPDQITAVGPTRWLALACRSGSDCHDEVIDSATGAGHPLPGPALRDTAWSWPPVGVISPNGATAGVLASGKDGKLTLELVNLRSGASTVVAVPLPRSASDDTLAWSPDSKWLFVAAAGGRLLAVNATSKHVASLGVQLPFITQVAVRPSH
jgi:hypothetical protein